MGWRTYAKYVLHILKSCSVAKREIVWNDSDIDAQQILVVFNSVNPPK